MAPTPLRNFKHSPRHFAWTAAAELSLAIVVTLAIVATPAAQAQTFTVIYSFSGIDGSYPQAGLTPDWS